MKEGNAKKEVIMKTKILVTVLVLVVLGGRTQAVDIDFYSDATIDNGDVYEIVSVYDTPPDFTTVDMIGGSVYVFQTYDYTTVNLYGGELTGQVAMWDSSTMNIYSGSVALDTPQFTDSSVLNIHGGNVSMGAPYTEGSSIINIYGYDFGPLGFTLTGYLSDGTPFEFTELTHAQSHINLIVIPEPATVFLLAVGALALRRRR
jgi:hypothetical protein